MHQRIERNTALSANVCHSQSLVELEHAHHGVAHVIVHRQRVAPVHYDGYSDLRLLVRHHTPQLFLQVSPPGLQCQHRTKAQNARPYCPYPLFHPSFPFYDLLQTLFFQPQTNQVQMGHISTESHGYVLLMNLQHRQ